MATPILPDHVNSIDSLTQNLPVRTHAPRPAGFMDFSRIEVAIQASQMIAKAPGFCPSGFLGKPEQILCAIQYGIEIGLSPMQALQSIAVINGKPSIYGDGLMALCQSFSECKDIKEEFDANTMTATCVVKRKGRSPVVHQWDVAKATKAGLWDKAGPWKQYPERMLQMRARGFALRDAFADRLKGIITAEKARDYPTREERHLNVVRPIRTNAIKQIAPEVLKVKKETKNHLKFLIAQCEVSQVTINKWFKKANANRFEDFTEEQAIKAIEYLESNNFEAKQAWIDFVKAREAYEHEQQLQNMMDEEQEGVAINA